MALSPKKRKQLIASAIKELGGTATTRQIADKTGLNANGVSQTIGWMDNVAAMGYAKGSAQKWQLLEE